MFGFSYRSKVLHLFMLHNVDLPLTLVVSVPGISGGRRDRGHITVSAQLSPGVGLPRLSPRQPRVQHIQHVQWRVSASQLHQHRPRPPATHLQLPRASRWVDPTTSYTVSILRRHPSEKLMWGWNPSTSPIPLVIFLRWTCYIQCPTNS